MLIPEEEAFLTWMAQQTEDLTIQEMRVKQAPGYDARRVQHLKNTGLLCYGIGVKNGEPVCIYRISDAGRRALLELEESRRKEAEAKKQQRFQNKLTIVAPFVTFFLGLILEHVSGILDLLRDLIFGG